VSPFFLIAVIAVAVVVAVATLALVRSRLRGDRLVHDSGRAGGFYNLVGTAFAVLLAFVVLVSFQSYNAAKGGAELEAVAVVELFTTAEFLPPHDRDAYQSQLACYARAAAAEWPLMAKNERNPAVAVWEDRLLAAAAGFDLDDASDQTAFGQLLVEDDRRAAGRRERLSEAAPVVTAPVWTTLLIGGLIVIFSAFVFIDRRERFAIEAMLTAAVTVMVVSGLLLIRFLDNPYADASGSIRPVEMERSIAIMDEARPELRPDCDEAGEPTS
jgi:hypothetical protein